MTLVVDAVRIAVSSQIRYLGLILNGCWRFEGHFTEIALHIGERANAFRRLLPNLGGPSNGVRERGAIHYPVRCTRLGRRSDSHPKK